MSAAGAVATTSRPTARTAAVFAALLSAVAAVPIAQAGSQWVIVAFGAIGIGVVLVVTRERALSVLLLLVMSLQFLFHKSVGAINPDIHSGANAIFINNIDALVLVLYGIWVMEGTIGRDVAAGLRQRAFVVPLIGSLAVLPSIVAAVDVQLAVAELVRMVWMFLLFLYVGLRVRTRPEIVMVVGAFCIIAAVQCVIALLQWKTGSSLGLSFLGEESSLGIRNIDDDTGIPRPTGTVVHPIFLAALLAPIGLIALSLAIVRRDRWRWVLLAAAGVAFLPIVITQARASLVATIVAVVLLGAGMLRAGRMTTKPLLAVLTVGVLFGVAFYGPISERVGDNLGTSQFETEVQARLELNGVALAMIKDSPIIGQGLNQFETVQPAYDTYGLLFAGNPVHNIYLLVMAETGVIGLVGFLALYGVALAEALRAARARDALVGGVGAGIAAALAFFAVEELLSFALRQEMPLTLFWILFGLAIACARLARAGTRIPGRADLLTETT